MKLRPSVRAPALLATLFLALPASLAACSPGGSASSDGQASADVIGTGATLRCTASFQNGPDLWSYRAEPFTPESPSLTLNVFKNGEAFAPVVLERRADQTRPVFEDPRGDILLVVNESDVPGLASVIVNHRSVPDVTVVDPANQAGLFPEGSCSVEGGSDGGVEPPPALPSTVTGTWGLVRYRGSVVMGIGAAREDVPLERSFDPLSAESQASFDIDAEGFGSIAGTKACRLPSLEPPPDAEVAKIHASRLLNAVEGLVGVVQALANLNQFFACQAGDRIEASVNVVPARGPFGGPIERLPANVGVLGEGSDTNAADAECAALGNVRYVRIDGADACIGFTDDVGREAKMLLVRPGEIHVQRLEFQQIVRAAPGF
ncbi:MAG TPA: hypothetical protein VFS43_01210 [Polyangiaceae bacterium]|nr:hypothetical protein [Polyangiaceae bacterium]